MPFEAAFMICGSACCIAISAARLSPAAIASSTFRTKLRMRERGTLLLAVRRAIFRAAFLADVVFAILNSSEYAEAVAGLERAMVKEGCDRREPRLKRPRNPWRPL